MLFEVGQRRGQGAVGESDVPERTGQHRTEPLAATGLKVGETAGIALRAASQGGGEFGVGVGGSGGPTEVLGSASALVLGTGRRPNTDRRSRFQ